MIGPPMTFPAGTRLRRISDPGLIGVATGERQQRPTQVSIEVELPDGSYVWWPAHHVEEAPIRVRRGEAFEKGRFGRAEDLRRALMIEKIRGDLTDVFYSMGTSDTDFYPHQFKPVLRFVESVTGRLLIADEVGLGKTIEALLIWKELEVRESARRLLVACPAVLRDKWRDELRNRFRVRAEIADVARVLERTREATHDASTGFALIGGLEGLRPPKATALGNTSARAKLEQLLESVAGPDSEAVYDLVIVDEAHYARNHETATNRLVRLLNGAARNVVFLTATPIQLNDDNLFQLLRIVDPDRFGDPDVFRRLLDDNAPVVAAHRALLDPSLGPEEIRGVLRTAEGSQPSDPVLAAALAELEQVGNLSPDRRIALALSVERISVLATAMTRSRKRDVLEKRVVRAPSTVRIRLSPIERRLYDDVTRAVIQRAGRLNQQDVIGRFALITRQRQMASCIKAALRVLHQTLDVSEELSEDYGELMLEGGDEAGPVEAPVMEVPRDVGVAAARLPDSKLAKLLEIVRERLAMNRTEKFVLFSYFRETLSYLAENLGKEGLTCHVLRGGMGQEKWATLRRFKSEPGPSILLSSEVGSEGIDLQFCRVLINYDLPWNPMKVEQRIGRIDRLGQEAERILIFNLVLDETIEERILLRLHERIGVFERSLGDMEQILGENVYKLILELFRDGLSDEERERQAELTIQAIANRAHQLDELEKEAGTLAAFTDYILEEVRSSQKLGRYIEPDALWTFACELLAEKYPGTKVENVAGQGMAWRMALSSRAKADLQDFLREAPASRPTRLAEPGVSPFVTPDPRWDGTLQPAPEVLDATHSMVLWLRKMIKDDPSSVYPVAAIEVAIDPQEGLPTGNYLYVIDRFSFRGLRREVRMRYAALELDSGMRLADREAERLVHLASRNGTTVPAIDVAPLAGQLAAHLSGLAAELAATLSEEEERLTRENESLCERQLKAVIARRDKLLAELKERLATAEASLDPNLRRTLPLRQAELKRAEERFDQQIHRVERSRAPLCDRSEVAAGLILVN